MPSSEYFKKYADIFLYHVNALQQIVLLLLLARSSVGTVESVYDKSFVCWYFWQTCESYVVTPAPFTSASYALYGLLILLSSSVLFFTVYNKSVVYMKALLLPGLIWIILHTLIFSHGAGHAYDYLYVAWTIVLLTTSQKEVTQVLRYFVVTVHCISSIFLITQLLAQYSPLGLVPYVSPAVSHFLTVCTMLLGASTSFLVLGISKRMTSCLVGMLCIVYFYSSLTTILEWRFAFIMVPLVLLFLIKENIHITLSRRSKGVILASIILLTTVQTFQWVRVTKHGALCLRPHLGAALSVNSAECKAVVTVTQEQGANSVYTYTSPPGRPCLCDPYTRWTRAKKNCSEKSVVAFALWTKVGQQNTKKVADIENICDSEFPVFARPEWLLYP